MSRAEFTQAICRECGLTPKEQSIEIHYATHHPGVSLDGSKRPEPTPEALMPPNPAHTEEEK